MWSLYIQRGTMPPSHEGQRDGYKSLTPRENQARLAKRGEVLCPQGAAEKACRDFRDQVASRPNNHEWMMSMLWREEPSRLKKTKQVRTPDLRKYCLFRKQWSICFGLGDVI